jgi:alpha-beta hydrolase superfamily lysophospholipase
LARTGRFFLLAAAFTLAGGLLLAGTGYWLWRSSVSRAPWFSEGQTVWIDTPRGHLKTRAYESGQLDEHPVLVVLVHGDIPDPRQGLYEAAQSIAHVSRNVVAAGMMRPGYTDAQGDMSSGKMGYAIGDNYTPEVVDDIDSAIRGLKTKYHAGPVVLIGHSGGAAISADLIGRHPEDVSAVLLLACGCDPNEFMTRWVREHPVFPKNLMNPSLLPLDLVPQVSQNVRVRMIIGAQDDVARVPASQAYARALEARGVDVKLEIVPGFGHNDIFRAPETRAAIAELLSLEGAEVHPPTAPAGPSQ